MISISFYEELAKIQTFIVFIASGSFSKSNLSTTDGTDVGIDIDRSPAMSIISIQLDAIGIAIIPLLDDDTSLPLADVGLDGAADRKAELVCNSTSIEAFLQEGNIEVLANEDESALTLFTFLPSALETTREHHSNALEDELLVFALDSDDTLVAVEVGTILHDETLNPGLHHGDIDLTFELGGRGHDRLVVLMLGIRIVEKFGLELQDALEIEGANVEKILGRDLAMLGTKNGSRGSELTKAILDGLELGFVLDDIRLIENDLGWWE